MASSQQKACSLQRASSTSTTGPPVYRERVYREPPGASEGCVREDRRRQLAAFVVHGSAKAVSSPRLSPSPAAASPGSRRDRPGRPPRRNRLSRAVTAAYGRRPPHGPSSDKWRVLHGDAADTNVDRSAHQQSLTVSSLTSSYGTSRSRTNRLVNVQGVSQITLQTQNALSPEIMRVFRRKFHCITGRSYLTIY